MVNQPEYRDFLGIGEGADADNEISNNYTRALFKYPDPQTCDQALTTIDNLQIDIDAKAAEKVQVTSAKGSGRPQSYYITGFEKRQAELKTMFQNMQCGNYFSEKQSSEFLDKQYDVLQDAGRLTAKATNTTTYLVIGMIGLVVIASGILILRK